MRVSAVLFAGAVLGWLVLVPLALFLNPGLSGSLSGDLATQVWSRQIRPLAVGTMIVAAFYTLYNLRESLVTGIGKALAKVGVVGPEGADRTQVDLNFKGVSVAIAVMAVATFGLYWYFAQSVAGALVLTVVMEEEEVI